MNVAVAINPCDELEERAAAGKPAPLRVITITEDRDNDFTVRQGDRYIGRLVKDEAMWVVANLLIAGHGDRCYSGLLTKEEHFERELQRNARLRARGAESC